MGREQVHHVAWGESYPHPFISCLMPWIAIFAIICLTVFGFVLWQWSQPRDIYIPPVDNMRLEEAEAILQNSGLSVQVDKTRQHSETIPAGDVIASNPPGGRRVKAGRTIWLSVSAGSGFTNVPDVRELTEAVARERLRQVGIDVAVEEYTYHDTIPFDRVIGITPNPGIQLKRGSTVNLTVSRGVKPAATAVTPEFRSTVLSIDLPNDTAESAEVRIDVTDDNGTRNVYKETHKPGEKLIETVQGTGQITAEVYFGDRLILTRKF